MLVFVVERMHAQTDILRLLSHQDALKFFDFGSGGLFLVVVLFAHLGFPEVAVPPSDRPVALLLDRDLEQLLNAPARAGEHVAK